MAEYSQDTPYKTAGTDAYEISDRAVLSKYPLVSVATITDNHEEVHSKSV